MAETKKKKVPVLLDEDLHYKARMKIADLDTSFNAVLNDLLRQWAFGEGKAPPALVESPPAKGLHALVNRALAEGATEPEVQAALECVIAVTRSRRPARPKRKAG